LEIKVGEGGLEKALKIFKKSLQRDGLMGELKKRRFYSKPSVRMKDKKREAQKRRAKSAKANSRRRD
jgi:small subunit ribosomal protein S21